MDTNGAGGLFKHSVRTHTRAFSLEAPRVSVFIASLQRSRNCAKAIKFLILFILATKFCYLQSLLVTVSAVVSNGLASTSIGNGRKW